MTAPVETIARTPRRLRRWNRSTDAKASSVFANRQVTARDPAEDWGIGSSAMDGASSIREGPHSRGQAQHLSLCPSRRVPGSRRVLGVEDVQQLTDERVLTREGRELGAQPLHGTVGVSEGLMTPRERERAEGPRCQVKGETEGGEATGGGWGGRHTASVAANPWSHPVSAAGMLNRVISALSSSRDALTPVTLPNSAQSPPAIPSPGR